MCDEQQLLDVNVHGDRRARKSILAVVSAAKDLNLTRLKQQWRTRRRKYKKLF